MSAEALIDTPVADTLKHGNRLTDEQKLQIHKLAAEGCTAVSIASHLGCSRQSVDYWIKELNPTAELARISLNAKAFRSVELWQESAEIAAKKGDHRAAKELAEAAMPDLRPRQDTNVNALTVMIGGLEPPIMGLSPVRLEGDERRSTETLAITSVSHKLPSVNVEVVDSKQPAARRKIMTRRKGKRA